MPSVEFEVVDAFRAVGVPEDKARAVVVSLNQAIDQRFALHASQLVTRGDLAEAIGALRAELGTLRAEMGGLRGEMTRLHAEAMTSIADLKTDVIKWCVGSMIALSGIMLALLRLAH